MNKDLYFFCGSVGITGEGEKKPGRNWKNQHRSGSNFWEQMFVLIAFTDGCHTRRSCHLTGTVLRSISLSLRLLLKKPNQQQKPNPKKQNSVREKGKRWHTQGTTPNYLGDTLQHPYYSFRLIRFWPLPSLFWHLRLMVSLLVKTP